MISPIILLSLLFVSFLGGESRALAKVREESNALELLYEARVRSALNTILRPNEYSVVLAIEISEDARLLGELETEMDKMGLPGVPGIPVGENMPFVNKLHQLKNRVEVHLVLDEAIPPEKESAAVALVRMKLHLDEAAGDNLVVVRSLLIPKEPKPEPPVAPPVETLPELTWRMWALVMIVSLLGLATLMFMLTRKRKSSQEMEMKKQWPELSFEAPLPTMPTDSGKSEEKKSEEAVLEEKAKFDQELVEFYERKKFVLEIAAKYPAAVSQAASEYFSKGNPEKTLLAFESLGWDTAKALFSQVSHRVWAKVGGLLAARTQDPSPQEYHEAIKGFHQFVVSRYLELIDKDVDNPFGFLLKLSSDDQLKALSEESPFNLATICVYLEDDQKSELLEKLPEDVQQTTLIQLSRLREVPFELVSGLASRLKMRLKEQSEKPNLSFDGQKYLVDLLNKLDVESEAKFIERLKGEQPQEFDQLRKSYLMYEDTLFVPADLIGEGVNSLDLKVLAVGLSGPEVDVRQYILSTLPEKKARMIEKDIAYLQGVSRKMFLAARRVMLASIRAQMAAREVTISGLMDEHAKSLQGEIQVA